jgi:hypothetical protein
MLNSTALTRFIAPRRQGAKKNIFLLSGLGVLCVFARVIVPPIRNRMPQISNTFG